MGRLERLELRALRWITCEWESPFADTVAAFVNDWVFGICFYVLLFLLTATRAKGRARFAGAVVTTLIALGLSHAVLFAAWRLAPRARPGDHFPEDRTLRGPIERASCGEHPDMWVERSHPPRSPAFPSSHAVTAGAVAAGLSTASLPAGAAGWAYALAVGAARLYGGKHWPSDVLGAFAIAAVCAWIGRRLSPGVLDLLRQLRPSRAPP